MMTLNCIFKPYTMLFIILLFKARFESLIIKQSLKMMEILWQNLRNLGIFQILTDNRPDGVLIT